LKKSLKFPLLQTDRHGCILELEWLTT